MSPEQFLELIAKEVSVLPEFREKEKSEILGDLKKTFKELKESDSKVFQELLKNKSIGIEEIRYVVFSSTLKRGISEPLKHQSYIEQDLEDVDKNREERDAESLISTYKFVEQEVQSGTPDQEIKNKIGDDKVSEEEIQAAIVTVKSIEGVKKFLKQIADILQKYFRGSYDGFKPKPRDNEEDETDYDIDDDELEGYDDFDIDDDELEGYDDIQSEIVGRLVFPKSNFLKGIIEKLIEKQYPEEHIRRALALYSIAELGKEESYYTKHKKPVKYLENLWDEDVNYVSSEEKQEVIKAYKIPIMSFKKFLSPDLKGSEIKKAMEEIIPEHGKFIGKGDQYDGEEYAQFKDDIEQDIERLIINDKYTAMVVSLMNEEPIYYYKDGNTVKSKKVQHHLTKYKTNNNKTGHNIYASDTVKSEQEFDPYELDSLYSESLQELLKLLKKQFDPKKPEDNEQKEIVNYFNELIEQGTEIVYDESNLLGLGDDFDENLFVIKSIFEEDDPDDAGITLENGTTPSIEIKELIRFKEEFEKSGNRAKHTFIFLDEEIQLYIKQQSDSKQEKDQFNLGEEVYNKLGQERIELLERFKKLIVQKVYMFSESVKDFVSISDVREEIVSEFVETLSEKEKSLFFEIINIVKINKKEQQFSDYFYDLAQGETKIVNIQGTFRQDDEEEEKTDFSDDLFDLDQEDLDSALPTSIENNIALLKDTVGRTITNIDPKKPEDSFEILATFFIPKNTDAYKDLDEFVHPFQRSSSGDPAMKAVEKYVKETNFFSEEKYKENHFVGIITLRNTNPRNPDYPSVKWKIGDDEAVFKFIDSIFNKLQSGDDDVTRTTKSVDERSILSIEVSEEEQNSLDKLKSRSFPTDLKESDLERGLRFSSFEEIMLSVEKHTNYEDLGTEDKDIIKKVMKRIYDNSQIELENYLDFILKDTGTRRSGDHVNYEKITRSIKQIFAKYYKHFKELQQDPPLFKTSKKNTKSGRGDQQKTVQIIDEILGLNDPFNYPRSQVKKYYREGFGMNNKSSFHRILTAMVKSDPIMAYKEVEPLRYMPDSDPNPLIDTTVDKTIDAVELYLKDLKGLKKAKQADIKNPPKPTGLSEQEEKLLKLIKPLIREKLKRKQNGKKNLRN